MIISEAEKNRIKKLHRELFILKEQGLGSMASVGSGFVNPQGGTGRVGEFLARQAELGEDCGGTHEDSVEKNQASYDFGEVELSEHETEEEEFDTFDDWKRSKYYSDEANRWDIKRKDRPEEESQYYFDAYRKKHGPLRIKPSEDSYLGTFGPDDNDLPWLDINDEVPTEIEIKEESTGREIHTHDEMIKYGEGSRWCPAAKDLGHIFNNYYEHYGPFIIYKNEDESVKIACINNECYDDQDNRLSLEEAAELLGVETLEDIAVQC